MVKIVITNVQMGANRVNAKGAMENVNVSLDLPGQDVKLALMENMAKTVKTTAHWVAETKSARNIVDHVHARTVLLV